ncbi:MAG: HAD-IB family hydrolase [Microscillaceae bacterium]|nr:HAD-IB family hydrolase [Microscillaceae bacterium]
MKKILENPKFQKILSKLAEQQQKSLEEITQEASLYLKELYTVHQPLADVLMIQAAQYILSRAYEKTIDIHPNEIKALAKIMRRHPVAFVMPHKTYIDMFVLGVVLARHGLPLPYTFAGINMSFLGLGQFGRQAGGIFIRRDIQNNPVYKATLRHYIASLVGEKASFMWALEGTRSRTGKLVWPKMGILKYIVEAEKDSGHEVKYVPVSIVYDLIPDVKEMTEEGRGKNKNPESLWWFIDYVRKMGGDFGKISLRLGEPVPMNDHYATAVPDQEEDENSPQYVIPRFAFELLHKINQITPVTTASVICTALLSKYSLTKRALESDVADLMYLIESHKPDALVDRGKALGECIQTALNLLIKSNLVKQQGDPLNAKYTIVMDNYLPATYYANMAAHHFYRRAFIELALLKAVSFPTDKRVLEFWKEIMLFRDLFKFEFFYSRKPDFSDEIEADLAILSPNWKETLTESDTGILELLQKQHVLVSPVILYTYTEAYRVVALGLQNWDYTQVFREKDFIEDCLVLGEEMHWQGRIRRLESVSKPFLTNGLRLAQNYQLIPNPQDPKQEALENFLHRLDDIAERISNLQGMTLIKPHQTLLPMIPVDREIVPGSKTVSLTRDILEGESGAHIGAFFDLDRTLIRGFSAVNFFQTRLFSGQMTASEIVAQFAGVLVYATGYGNFSSLASIGAQGVKGIAEQVFIEVGEEVYLKHLADAIYPESRALVAAHLAQGHTVAIVSAATPYQVNPIARDLVIEHVMCTRLEVEKGKFTGKVIDPPCWGAGKAQQAYEFADKMNLDLSKSYFYTDSVEDLPLLEIVGHPRPLNPDTNLSAKAYENDWPVYRFNDEERPGVSNFIRTGLAIGSLIPAVLTGLVTGASNLSWSEGINSTIAAVGDFGTMMAGIKLVVKGEENLWSHRPAVFIFSHQSSADFFIVAKLLRKNARAIAKKELQWTPLGPLLMAAGVIFVDRSNRDKAIEAMKPAIDALKNGTSIAIAPEGTRSEDYKLGPFKKGAFHLAMQAHVPLVPIVIKNAHDAMPKGSSLFRPTAVEVVVLPPVSTADWHAEYLDQHIADVRQLFLNELGQDESSQPLLNSHSPQ